jgi:hypothetical protein
VLAIITITCAVLGIAYNAGSLTHLIGRDGERELTRLTPFALAFWGMTGICLACYGALIFGGLQLLRGRSQALFLLAGVWLFEILYFVIVAASWLLPEVGLSIAAATGVANGGLMLQFVILLPLWGPLLALWLGWRRRVQPV